MADKDNKEAKVDAKGTTHLGADLTRLMTETKVGMSVEFIKKDQWMARVGNIYHEGQCPTTALAGLDTKAAKRLKEIAE